jgi:hypothetical protein
LSDGRQQSSALGFKGRMREAKREQTHLDDIELDIVVDQGKAPEEERSEDWKDV